MLSMWEKGNSLQNLRSLAMHEEIRVILNNIDGLFPKIRKMIDSAECSENLSDLKKIQSVFKSTRVVLDYIQKQSEV